MTQRSKALAESRQDKLRKLRAQGIDPYPPRFHRTHSNQEAVDWYEKAEAGRGEGYQSRKKLAVAGRITALRDMGKAAFLDLRDGSQRLQVHLRSDVLEESYNLMETLDLGDFLGVEGSMFRTRRGEITLQARSIVLLAKAHRPPPEKWHGLRDVEIRYRQRYLDLIANPDVKTVFQNRSRVISTVRSFMDGRGYIEVETPVMVPVAAGAMARPFVTKHNALDRVLYLRIATELYLKRLIIGGLDRVYEIGRIFRNEGIDMDHNPEFTMLESYEAYADYNDIMALVEQMVSTAARTVNGSARATFHGHEIDFTPPWRRLSLKEELKKAGLDIEELSETEELVTAARAKGVETAGLESRGRIIDKLVGSLVEPNLIQPTFLVDYPVEMSPLAKAKGDDPRYAERFEAFAGGMEIANSFTELNDPEVQRERFQEQERLRESFGDEDFDRLDEDFLTAMEYGMPPTGGLGVGIDRLVMLLTGQDTIRDVVLFPQLRSKGPEA